MSKYLAINDVNGSPEERNAITASTGAPDGLKIVATNASGRFDESLMPLGVGADAQSATASEAIGAAKLVNFHEGAGGILSIRLADASNGREAQAFTKSAIANGAVGLVFMEGQIEGLTGLAIATRYYLGLAGNVTDIPPTTSGHILQHIGNTLVADELNFEPDRPITRA